MLGCTPRGPGPCLAGAEGPPAAPAHVRGLPASLLTLLGCRGCCLYFTLFFSSSSHVIISNGSFEFSPSVYGFSQGISEI